MIWIMIVTISIVGLAWVKVRRRRKGTGIAAAR